MLSTSHKARFVRFLRANRLQQRAVIVLARMFEAIQTGANFVIYVLVTWGELVAKYM